MIKLMALFMPGVALTALVVMFGTIYVQILWDEGIPQYVWALTCKFGRILGQIADPDR